MLVYLPRHMSTNVPPSIPRRSTLALAALASLGLCACAERAALDDDALASSSGELGECAPDDGQLNVVAHQDDDLLFLNPSILRAIAHGRRVRTIYMTAGNIEPGYWPLREQGELAAYAYMAGRPNQWTE